MWPAHGVAQGLGQELGRGEGVQRRLPGPRGAGPAGGGAMSRLRHLLVVLGDQLDLQASCFDGADAQHDAVWMAEVAEESTHVWSSKPRIALFLAAMRHHAQALRGAGWRVDYRHLDDPGNLGSLGAELRATIARLKPQGLVMTAPGDWRVLQAIQATAKAQQKPLMLCDDLSFFTTVRDFAAHAKGRKQLRMEYWYRELRVRHQVLMDGEQPLGGQWNFDADNREAFGKEGPPPIPAPARFEPNETTRGVLQLVAERFAAHPGSLDSFAWPVTREQALQSLKRFIRERLPHFGRWQDAMWTGEVWLFHSHLAAALNLKLLTAREVVQAAEAAYRRGEADLASTEGFIRQILGWREYVRGVYWLHMQQYLQRIKDLENLALNYTGVEKAYAIQAGRELRVIVEAEKVTDGDSDKLSFDIAQKIQTEMTYPGQIKVTVIREKRAVNVAR